MREFATLAISPSVIRADCSTASCTSLLGSRRRMLRTSRLPFLFAHSTFFATPSFMICCVIESFFSSSCCSSALPGATGLSSPSGPVTPICSRAASARASVFFCSAATFFASSSSCSVPPWMRRRAARNAGRSSSARPERTQKSQTLSTVAGRAAGLPTRARTMSG